MAAGATALLLLIGGTTAAVTAFLTGSSGPGTITTVGDAAAADVGGPDVNRNGPVWSPEAAPIGMAPAASRTSDKADRTANRDPDGENKPAPTAATSPTPRRPVITTRIQVETQLIAYGRKTVPDPSLPHGVKQVRVPGVAGVRTLRYLITLTDGRATKRRLLDTTVTRAPADEIVARGTRRDSKPDDCADALCVLGGRSPLCPETTATPIDLSSSSPTTDILDELDIDLQASPGSC